MIESGDAERLQKLCKSYLTNLGNIQEELDEVKAHPWDEIKQVYEAARRIEKFCKCMLLLCNDSTAAGCIHDVLWFKNYKGTNLFEKTVKQCLGAAGFFKDQVAEVVKTAASTKSLEPKLKQLQELLRKKDLNQGDLLLCLNLLSEVQSGMRKGAVELESKSLMERICKMAENTMASSASSISESFVQTILDGLERFNEHPGILDMSTQLQSFMTHNQGTLASNALEQHLMTTKDKREVDALALGSLVQKCDTSTVSQSLLDNFENLTFELFTIICGKAGVSVGWVSGSSKLSTACFLSLSLSHNHSRL